MMRLQLERFNFSIAKALPRRRNTILLITPYSIILLSEKGLRLPL